MADQSIPDYNRPMYTKKDLWWVATKVAIGTFVVAGILFQFRDVQKVQVVEHGTMNLRTEYVNGRIDRKHDDQQKDIDKNEQYAHEEFQKIWNYLNTEQQNKQSKQD